ncbi:hypothetical protein V8F20_010764 [Naviculisporaceae sp. PSN 640]
MPSDQQRQVPHTPTRPAARQTQMPRSRDHHHPSQITSVLQVPQIERPTQITSVHQVPPIDRTSQGTPVHHVQQHQAQLERHGQMERTPQATPRRVPLDMSGNTPESWANRAYAGSIIRAQQQAQQEQQRTMFNSQATQNAPATHNAPATPNAQASPHAQVTPHAQVSPNAQIVISSSPSVANNTPTTTKDNEADGSDRWLTDRIVTVKVGQEGKKWAVHAKLLCSKSKFFDSYFNGNEEHQGQDIMSLPAEDPKLFALLVRWLYGTAFANSGGTRIFRFSPPDGRDITVRDYIGLYILGDKIQIMGVKNAAVDALYAYFGPDADKDKPTDPNEIRAPDLRDIQYCFENTAPDSHMRRLLVAHALFYLFGKKRLTTPLPAAWEEVISKNGEIAWSMVKMLSDWKWVMGVNVPHMKIKARQDFHEKPFVPPPASSLMVPPGATLGPDGQVIKAEPGAGEEEEQVSYS